MGTNYSYSDEALKTAVVDSTSYKQVHEKLHLRGYNYYALRKRIKQLGLDTSHINGNGLPLSRILIENSTYLKTGHLKNRLFKAGLKYAECEVCGLTEWQGRSINLHLHHVNGIHTDNRLENLQTLCPNCHSQTENFGVFNRGKGRKRK